MRLTTPLKVELGDGKKWRLAEKFRFYTTIIDKDKEVWFEVEEGFETDFASVPKIFMPFLQWKDKFNKASVVHDYLYHTKITTRKQADKIFLELMLALGINRLKAYTFYFVVRLFGWLYWRKLL